MKKLLKIVFAAAVIVLGVASCQKETHDVPELEIVYDTVKFTLNSPDFLSTKAIGDGKMVKDVYYTAFVDGKPVHSLENKIQLENGSAEFEVSLVRNVTYKFVFWAQSPVADGAEAPYDLSEFYATSCVSVDYTVPANDDARDAFCAAKEITVKGEVSETVYLKRPFAQVNFCASDYELLKDLGLHNGLMSEVKVYGLPDVLKVLDGSVSSASETSATVDASFSLADVPSGEDEYITVKGNTYGYVAMNYVLATEIGETVRTSARMVNGTDSWETSLIENVPVRRNYKTNIVGEMFAENATLKIIVVPAFNIPDEVVPM